MKTLLEALKQTINETKVRVEYESSTDSFRISVTTAKIVRQLAANARGDRAMYNAYDINRIRHQSRNNVVVTTSTTIARSALGIQKDDIFHFFANSDVGVESDPDARSSPMLNMMSALSEVGNVLNNIPCSSVHSNPRLLNFLMKGQALPAPSNYNSLPQISELDESIIFYTPQENVQMASMQMEPVSRIQNQYFANSSISDAKFDVDSRIFHMFDTPRDHNPVLPNVDVDSLAETLRNIHLTHPGAPGDLQLLSDTEMLAIEWK